MSALHELNKLITNSKFIPKEKKQGYDKSKSEAELEFIKDLLFRGKNEKTNNKK